jgi:hypothetical protein
MWSILNGTKLNITGFLKFNIGAQFIPKISKGTQKALISWNDPKTVETLEYTPLEVLHTEACAVGRLLCVSICPSLRYGHCIAGKI